MKKYTQLFKKLLLPVVIFTVITDAAHAQTYFAGTSAGTGNTGAPVTAVGPGALSTANSGFSVDAFGYNALQKNTTGHNNAAFGSTALANNTSGSFNIAVGNASLFSNTTGYNNTSIGFSAMQLNTTGYQNTAIGCDALHSNTTGYHNTAIGKDALISNTTGGENSAIGIFALNFNTTGGGNTAVGNGALVYNTTAYRNTAIGYIAMASNRIGVENAATGTHALFSNTSGNYNSATGAFVLYSNTTGSNNAALGNWALKANRTGSYNVAVGDSAGWQFLLYNNCTFLGKNADATVTGLTNATALGNGASVNASNKVVVGNTAVTSIGGQVGWTTFSDANLKTNINKSKLGLNFILQLNPVTYTYKAEGQKNILYTGLIAQEVDAAAKKTGTAFSGVDKNGEHWGIRYAELTVPIIKAVQEQNESVTALQEENKQLKLRIEKLEKAFTALQGGSIADAKASPSVLFQNNPNPYTNTTTIKYALAPAVTHAQLIIRNSAGATVKTITLNSLGTGQAVITAKEMAAGIYTCSLYTNGQLADTKMLVQTN
jgi:trimeric autotransporter adhesin